MEDLWVIYSALMSLWHVSASGITGWCTECIKCRVNLLANANLQEDRKKKELKMKLQMAKFLQDTMKEMAVESKNPGKNKAVKEFADFIEKVSCRCTIL